MVTPEVTERNAKNRPDDVLWKSVPDNYRDRLETRFNDWVQDKCLKSLEMTDKLERSYMPDRSIIQHNKEKHIGHKDR